MQSKELYKQKYEAQMQAWEAKLSLMKANSDKLSAEAKLKIKPRVDAAHAKLDAAKATIKQIAGSTDDRWHEVAKEVDQVWADLKDATEGAYEAIKSHATKA